MLTVGWLERSKLSNAVSNEGAAGALLRLSAWVSRSSQQLQATAAGGQGKAAVCLYLDELASWVLTFFYGRPRSELRIPYNRHGFCLTRPFSALQLPSCKPPALIACHRQAVPGHVQLKTSVMASFEDLAAAHCPFVFCVLRMFPIDGKTYSTFV